MKKSLEFQLYNVLTALLQYSVPHPFDDRVKLKLCLKWPINKTLIDYSLFKVGDKLKNEGDQLELAIKQSRGNTPSSDGVDGPNKCLDDQIKTLHYLLAGHHDEAMKEFKGTDAEEGAASLIITKGEMEALGDWATLRMRDLIPETNWFKIFQKIIMRFLTCLLNLFLWRKCQF